MNENTKLAPLATSYSNQKFNKELKQLKAQSNLDYSAVAEVKRYEEKKYNLLTTNQKKAFDKFKKQFLMVIFKPLFNSSFSEVAELYVRTQMKYKSQNLSANVKPELDIAGVPQKELNSKLAFLAMSLLDKDNFILATLKKIEKKRATLKSQGKRYEGPTFKDVLKQI